MSSYQYRDSRYQDKMVARPFYLYNKTTIPQKTFFVFMMTSSNGNIFPGEFPSQRPVTRSFDVFFDLHQNKRLSKHREVGDLRRLRAHYDVIVLSLTGNSWGTDPDGTSCLGCGDQEQFYGCSDVAISKDGASGEGTAPPPTSGTTTTTKPPTQTTTKSPTQTTTTPSDDDSGGSQGNCVATGNYSGDESMDEWCHNNCAMGYCPATHCTCGGTDKDGQPRMDCMAVGSWIGQASMDKWCKVNCPAGNCPKSHCLCADSLYDKLIKLATLYKSGEPEIMHEKKGVATQYQGQFEQ